MLEDDPLTIAPEKLKDVAHLGHCAGRAALCRSGYLTGVGSHSLCRDRRLSWRRKTTLVNGLLRQAGGRRIAVLVNEFGALPIDQDLIEGQEGSMMLLAGAACVAALAVT